MENLEQSQRDLEEWTIRSAREQQEIARHRRAAQGAAGEDPLNRKLIDSAAAAVAEGIRAWIDQHNTGKVGKRPSGLTPIKAIGPERAAVLGLTACFNTMPKNSTVTRVAEAIGHTIERELWLSDLVDKAPKLALRLFKQVAKRHTSREMQLKAIRQIAARELYEIPMVWRPVERVRIGEPVLDAILRHSRLIEIWQWEGAEKRARRLVFTEEAITAMEELAQFSSFTRMPMVVQPHPWPKRPYRTWRTNRSLNPVRITSEAHRIRLREDHKHNKLGPVYAALNRLQGVPFRINRRVLGVLTELWNRGEHVGKMPRKHPYPEAARPEDFGELPPEKQKGWLLSAHLIKFKNAVEIPGQRMVFQRCLYTAEYLADFDRFYIPVNLDFRGRVVPIPVFHYQLADPFRGLFEFAEGKPLGPEGFKWLSIHLTNCGDFDKSSKKSYERRLSWAAENSGWLWKCASDPVANREWTKAENPFQFLAALFEWKEASSLERPEEYISYCPIGLDGSNSGLQHYSAIMRSPEEAAMVNLLPLPQPADVYQTVADRVKELLTQSPSDLASLWLSFGVDRKTVKRSVMTSLYGSGRFGYGNHLKDDLMRPLEAEVLDGILEEHPLAVDDDGGSKAAMYLAGLIDQALKETLTRTNEAMAWVRATAGALAKAGRNIQWVGPVGWPVVNHYEEITEKQVELFLYNRQLSLSGFRAAAKDKVYVDGSILDRIRCRVQDEKTGELCKFKQRNTIAPNLIHSMDAAHLMLTVEAAAEEGITAVMTIHDCFATHAGETERFAQILREQFVQMYESYDPLDELYSYAKPILGEKVEPPPARGDLDLRQVLKSPYFFA